ncbi:hypothetical protein CPC08DRAFT_678791 [Agrocybe pediades]|nr:hypothetical protein CPC08DRAFT_678791 [Agrocybe pediades]
MASHDPSHYLAVLKASYDYEPQSDDEVAIKEDQLLLLVEKVDEDWWKVKIKAATQEADSPVGLVPAAYVEQAEHISIVKALYDYEAAAPGELSVAEDDLLMVFETEDDWILVQDSKAGKAGYVPGNYVEVVEEEEEQPAAAPTVSRIVVPDSPPRPVSSYVDPADRVASSKVTADDIQTWSVSEIDKKGKKKKGTLGIGNGAVFFASEADKTPVQKWQTKDVKSVSSEKSKHITIDIGGPNPTTLHFHTGSKDTADSIISKFNTSKALAAGQSHEDEDVHQPPPTPELASREPRNVHFSTTSTIIPSSQDVAAEDEESPVDEPDAEAIALYDFQADGEDELSVTEGEALIILEKDGDEWWKCRNSRGDVGVVPASYLETTSGSGTNHLPQESAAQREREAAEREAQELARRQEEEEEHERERERRRREQEEQQQAAAAARKLEAQQKAKQAAAAAEAERRKRQEAAASRAASPPAAAKSPARQQDQERPKSSGAASTSTRNSIEVSPVTRPPPDKTRIWHDRTGQFKVEAAFLGFNNGKLRLHKVNGVIVEVPSEKMSLEDMRYAERLLNKSRRPTNPTRVPTDDDNVPLAITHPKAAAVVPPTKKAPQIDWFDFFLSAGCDLDDCTRYASSFERDKIDETLLSDITESTMRSLGLREGDIIRVRKAIEKRKPTDNLQKPSAHIEEQLRRDKELAERLQAEETANAPRAPAPNLFAGPGGVLKAPRRGRPQTTKSVPLDNVDIKAIPSTPDQILRTTSPQSATLQTPSLPARPASAAVARPSSTAPVASGFDDDAWTNRPSSTKPVKAASPAPAPPPPPTPPVQVQPPPPAPTAAPATLPPATTPTPAAASPSPAGATNSTPSMTKSPDADLFDQIARLSALRQNSTPQQPANPSPAPAFNAAPAHASFRAGLGMSTSPLPMGQLTTAQPSLSPLPSAPYNGPRGPFAPVPANQGLLQPLIPTQTGFNGFIPTKPVTSPFTNQLSPPNFLSQQPTGFPASQPLMSQPTGMFSTFNPNPSFQGNGGGFTPVQNHVTGFIPSNNGSNFGNMNGFSSPPPVPPLPSANQNNNNNNNNTSPANVFAQMKSGTFATEDNATSNSNLGLNGQTPGWGQSYQGYTGY